MSIYATLWQIKVPVFVPCTPEEKEWEEYYAGDNISGPGRPVHERWIEVFAQAVPAHIGHEGAEADPDWYAAFLPPRVDYDPIKAWTSVLTPRAVFIIDEDHMEKKGQQYLAPLMMLTGAEYEEKAFSELLQEIDLALNERFASRGVVTRKMM